MFSIVTTPAKPDSVNKAAGVISHFQCNSNFEKIYQSDDEVGQLAEVSARSLNLGCRLAWAFENRDLHRITAYAEESSLAVFALEGTDPDSPGQRVFGLKLKPDANVSLSVNEVATLI